MSLCIGIDFSTKRIDLAAIAFDPSIAYRPDAYQFTVHRIGGAGDAKRPIDYQRVRRDLVDALRALEVEAGDTIATACVEAPAGKVHPSLHALHGALLSSVPPRVAVASIYPVQWRGKLGRIGRDSKDAGHELVRAAWPTCASWDEHELDALGIATAWRLIQWEAIPA